ncbi:MAG: hypothetical protein OXU36_13965 [Candidatus Poribacteria bacterium]|nr:hypothetical protein [Candidatus Poribacteria bacterium]
MLQKKIWIPICIVLIAVMSFGIYYGQMTANQQPVKVYKTTQSSLQPASETTQVKAASTLQTSESGHWHGDEWHTDDAHSEGSNPEGMASVLNADRQARIDAEIQAARQQGATDAEILKRLQAAGHQGETDSQRQEALYTQRVTLYLKAREAWNKKFHQAHTERMQAGEAIVSFIPNLSRDLSHKETVEYFNNLSDAERKRLQAEIRALIEKRDAAEKKLEAVMQEEPVYPTNK